VCTFSKISTDGNSTQCSFSLANLNNATLLLLGGKKPCQFQTLAKVDGKRPFINVKVATCPTLLKRAEVNSLSTAAQPTRY